jgi:hypothetical protein
LVNAALRRRRKSEAKRRRNLKIQGVLNPRNNQKTGETMTTQTIQHGRQQAERFQDILLVSSFAFWAVLLGLVPVLAYHLAMKA